MPRNSQGGYILLALLLVVFITGSSFLFGLVNQRQVSSFQTDESVLRELQAAKAALLYYAANTPALYADAIGPGYLPCPDTDNDGSPDTNALPPGNLNCPNGTRIGRLPESVPLPDGSTFQLSNAFAGNDQQLWYAVSPRHLRTIPNTAATQKINAGLSRLTLDNQSNVVALIFAPGPAVPGQSRTPATAEVLAISNYLDGNENTDGDDVYSALEYTPADDADSFNDRVIAITHDELMRHVGMAAARRIKQELDVDYLANGGDYRDCADLIGRPCPWAESAIHTAMNSSWLSAESWNSYNSVDWYISLTPFVIITYYRYTTTLYFREPPGSSPTLIFNGCAGMRYELDFAAGVIRNGDQC